MTEEFQEALLQVAKAMDGLTRAFEHRVSELRTIGDSQEQVAEVVKAIQAVKDSGALYLTWANHYAKRISDNSGNAEGDDLLDDEVVTDE